MRLWFSRLSGEEKEREVTPDGATPFIVVPSSMVPHSPVPSLPSRVEQEQ